MKLQKYIVGTMFCIILMSFNTSMFRQPAITITGNKTIGITTDITETLVADSVMIKYVLTDNLNIQIAYAEIEQEMEKMAKIQCDNFKKTCSVKIKYASKPYKISKRGKDFIKSHEKCKLHQYHLKGEKYYTIGWGHQINPVGSIPPMITQKQADDIFDNDCIGLNEAANRLLSNADPNMKVTQGFVDGLCSLIYNCGERGVSRTRFYKRLCSARVDKNGNINIKDLEYALAAVKTANISWAGHKPRRQHEYKMMANK